MTDEQIIKNFRNGVYKNKPMLFGQKFLESVLDLIKRQKAKIESLEKELMKCKLEKELLYNVSVERQNIAIKEFEKRLKETITNAINTYYNSNGGGYYLAEDVIEDIDDLVKEMTDVEK